MSRICYQRGVHRDAGPACPLVPRCLDLQPQEAPPVVRHAGCNVPTFRRPGVQAGLEERPCRMPLRRFPNCVRKLTGSDSYDWTGRGGGQDSAGGADPSGRYAVRRMQPSRPVLTGCWPQGPPRSWIQDDPASFKEPYYKAAHDGFSWKLRAQCAEEEVEGLRRACCEPLDYSKS